MHLFEKIWLIYPKRVAVNRGPVMAPQRFDLALALAVLEKGVRRAMRGTLVRSR